MIALVVACALVVVGTLIAMIFRVNSKCIDAQIRMDLLEAKIVAIDVKTLPRC